MPIGIALDKNKTRQDLKPLNAVIQQCPECGAVDVYKDDGHKCDAEYQEYLRSVREAGI